RHPVLTFYLIAFLISWGGIVAIIWATGGIPATKEELDAQLPMAIPAMLGGPSIAALLTTWWMDGATGLRELVTRLTRWRVAPGWDAVALFAAPLVAVVTAGVMALVAPGHGPGILGSGDWPSRLAAGLAAGLVVGIFEEVGWTGFAVPRLRRRHSVLATGLIVGVLWGPGTCCRRTSGRTGRRRGRCPHSCSSLCVARPWSWAGCWRSGL
ncbi:MAG TPA: CPBP family intramembrane glutamic endopeptidase, partial [Propionicimonas sp.]